MKNVPKCKNCHHWFYGETVHSLGKQYNCCKHPARANETRLTKQDVVTSPQDCPIRKNWDDRLNGKILVVGGKNNG